MLKINNAKKINKADQVKLNGGFGPIDLSCKGAVSFSPDGTCPAGQRLIGHCICCDD